MTVSIRAATAPDADAMLALWRAAGLVESHTDDVEAVRALIAHDPGAALVAEDGAEIVGTVIAAWDGWRGQFFRLAVGPEVRRAGVGRALVVAGERRLLELGARRIAAIVVDDDEGALAFWTAAGYERLDQARYARSW